MQTTKVIKFSANNERLGPSYSAGIPSDSVAWVRAEFTLGDGWNGFQSVRAVWQNRETVISTVLDSDGACDVPWEVLRRRGDVMVNLVGSDVDGDDLIDRLTTFRVKALKVADIANIDGSETVTVTPSQFEQFVSIVTEEAEAAEGSATDAANSATEAAGSATAAEESAQDARSAADSIGDAVEQAQAASEQAMASATSAETSAGVAAEAVTATQGYAQTASSAAESAETSAFDAAASAAAVDGLAPLIEANRITDTASGSIASFPDGAGNISMDHLIVSIEPVQAGSGTPSPDNVRAISGWTEVVTQRTGKNVWGGTQLRDDILAKVQNSVADDTNKTIQYDASNVSNKVLFDKFKPNTQYTVILKGYNTNQSTQTPNLRILYTDGTTLSLQNFVNGVSRAVSNASKSIKSINGQWVTSSTYLYYDECGVFEGALTTDQFEPYQGETYTTTLPSTVYGGTLDVVTGELMVDKAMVDLGTLRWGYTSSNAFFHAPLTDIKRIANWNTVLNAISSIYKAVTGNEVVSSTQDFVMGETPNESVIRVRNSNYTDATAFKSAMNGVQLVYELATPQTYQLTPTEVKTLMGANNVWADAGAVEVTYTANLREYLAKIMA